MPEIHGHRGARALRPENTLPGLACALDLGVDAIVTDRPDLLRPTPPQI